MNNVWLSLRDTQSPVLYRNPDAELPARFVMSIGDALPAANVSVALPARTITITKGNGHHVLCCGYSEVTLHYMLCLHFNK
jgi:hypothetical protein